MTGLSYSIFYEILCKILKPKMYFSLPVSSCVEDASSGTSHVVYDTENVHLCEKSWDDQTQSFRSSH